MRASSGGALSIKNIVVMIVFSILINCLPILEGGDIGCSSCEGCQGMVGKYTSGRIFGLALHL
jgi:hypothetical protein